MCVASRAKLDISHQASTRCRSVAGLAAGRGVHSSAARSWYTDDASGSTSHLYVIIGGSLGVPHSRGVEKSHPSPRGVPAPRGVPPPGPFRGVLSPQPHLRTVKGVTPSAEGGLPDVGAAAAVFPSPFDNEGVAVGGSSGRCARARLAAGQWAVHRGVGALCATPRGVASSSRASAGGGSRLRAGAGGASRGVPLSRGVQ